MTLFAENAKDNKCICESFIEKNKRVFDLEKENAELKMGLKWDADNRDELLKENAKLKETVACLREDIDVKRKDIDWYKKRGVELDSMLTDKIREIKKAKQIIKELLDLRCSVSSAKDVENRFAVREKAKRFLEEEEMTDEEKLAEEYVKSVIDVNAFDWKIVREIGLAFLAGLKAGRPKWHKVADGDLPKNENRVLLYFGVDDYNDGQFIRGRFWCDSCGWFDIEEVVAWCEMSEYTEE